MESVETVEVTATDNTLNSLTPAPHDCYMQQSQPDLFPLLPFDKEYACLTDEELHQAVLRANASFQRRCFKVMQVAQAALHQPLAVLIPLCEEIIERYKMLGVAAKDRAYGQPTVEAYFRSISLNYNTVRVWFHRYPELLRKAILEAPFVPDKPQRLSHPKKVIRRYLDARRTGVGVYETLKDLEAIAPAPQVDFDEAPPVDEKLPELTPEQVREVFSRSSAVVREILSLSKGGKSRNFRPLINSAWLLKAALESTGWNKKGPTKVPTPVDVPVAS